LKSPGIISQILPRLNQKIFYPVNPVRTLGAHPYIVLFDPVQKRLFVAISRAKPSVVKKL
jgi:hypothetical protein